MSHAATNWAFEQNLRPAQKITLLAIADYVDENGVAWPSMKTLASKTSMSESSVRRQIQRLEDEGFIEVTAGERPNGSQTSNRYRLRMAPPSQNDRGPLSTVTPPEPSLEPDLTKTSTRQSLPIADAVPTDSDLTPVQQGMVNRAGLLKRDIDEVRFIVALILDRKISTVSAMTLAFWILDKARVPPRMPGRYVIAAIQTSPAEVQQYIDEAALS